MSTKEKVQAVFQAYKKKYPSGTPWNNTNKYITKTKVKIPPFFAEAHCIGCAAWTFMLQDAIYGFSHQRTIPLSQVRASDYFHTGEHWGVITALNQTHFRTTEGNYNNTIQWDILHSKAELKQATFYTRRKP